MLKNIPLSVPLCQKYRKDKPEKKKSLVIYSMCVSVCVRSGENGMAWVFLGRKAMRNLDCILKSRDITLPTKL